MNDPQLDALIAGPADAALSRRQLNRSLLAGLLALPALGSPLLPAEAEAAESAARGISASQMGLAALGPGFGIGPGYLDRSYHGYSSPVRADGRGSVYIRHTGRDFRKPAGSPVHALTGGVVTRIIGIRSQPISLCVMIADGRGHYWAYGHMVPAVREGQRIARGQVIGRIANPRGAFKPHVHISAMSVPYPTRSKAVNDAIGWGRAYGRTGGQAQANATRFTDDPLLVYARSLR